LETQGGIIINKMAHTTLVGMLREDGATKNMAPAMREISTMNAMEETRRKLREKIDDACGSRKMTENTRNTDKFSFKTPRMMMEGWKASLRQRTIEPVKDIYCTIRLSTA
jgi:hypothetical protein